MSERRPGRMRVQVDRTTYGPWTDAVRLRNAGVELVVVPRVGRIMYYGRPGGTNVLWNHPDLARAGAATDGWANWGGDKVWPWPQEAWRWSPPGPIDTGPYTAELYPSEGAVVLKGPTAAGARAIRVIKLAPAGTRVTLESWFERSLTAGEAPSSVPLPWSVTQVASPDRVAARLMPGVDPAASEADGTPGAGLGVPTQADEDWLVWQVQYDRDRKSLVAADMLAARVGNQVLVQQRLPVDRSPVLPRALSGPCQIYHPPRQKQSLFPPGTPPYVELEFAADPALQSPGRESPRLLVEWSLLPLGATGLAQVLHKVGRDP